MSPNRTAVVQQQMPSSSRLHLSPERIAINPKTINLSPQKILSPQDGTQHKVTISPQAIAMSRQNIKLSPQKIGNISALNTGSSPIPVGQIRVTPAQANSILQAQSIISPTGAKQVSLIGSMQNKIALQG